MIDNLDLPSNKKFGFFFSLILLALYLYLLFFNNLNYYLILAASLVLVFISIFSSNILTKANFLWFKFGVVLSKLFSPIILSVIFFIIITPVAIFMKIINRDLLKFKKKNEKSYWENYENKKINMKDQY